MENQIDERVRNLEVRMAMNEQRMNTVAQDIKDMKATLIWLNRLALGAVIASVINLVIKAGV